MTGLNRIPSDRTYEPSLLTEVDVTSLDFARTWARTLLKDYPEVNAGGIPTAYGQPLNQPLAVVQPEFGYSDTQLNAALALDAVTDRSVAPAVMYYRPHLTAARLYLGNPSIWQSRAVDGSSESRRSAKEIVGAWISQGLGLDALIPLYLHPLPSLNPESTAVSGRLGTRVVSIRGGW